MRCPNCDSQLSCGCQKRTASDGKEVCTNCMSFYEASVTNTPANPMNTNSPSNIKVVYTPPRKIDTL